MAEVLAAGPKRPRRQRWLWPLLLVLALVAAGARPVAGLVREHADRATLRDLEQQWTTRGAVYVALGKTLDQIDRRTVPTDGDRVSRVVSSVELEGARRIGDLRRRLADARAHGSLHRLADTMQRALVGEQTTLTRVAQFGEVVDVGVLLLGPAAIRAEQLLGAALARFELKRSAAVPIALHAADSLLRELGVLVDKPLPVRLLVSEAGQHGSRILDLTTRSVTRGPNPPRHVDFTRASYTVVSDDLGVYQVPLDGSAVNRLSGGAFPGPGRDDVWVTREYGARLFGPHGRPKGAPVHAPGFILGTVGRDFVLSDEVTLTLWDPWAQRMVRHLARGCTEVLAGFPLLAWRPCDSGTLHIVRATPSHDLIVRLPGYHPTWPGSISPDGRLLSFFWSGDDGRGRIGVVDTRTGAAQSVPGPSGGFASGPVWTADSRRFFFASPPPDSPHATASIWTYEIGSPRPVTLRYFTHGPATPVAVLP